MKTNVNKHYLIWVTDADGGYWAPYDSIEDAVESGGDGCEVYVMEPKFLGRFKRKVEMVKLKQRRKHAK